LRPAPHTLSIFDDDLERLRAMVCEMGGRVEAAVDGAMAALLQHDDARALRVIEDDLKVDALAARVEQEAVHLVALRSPLADDLREVLAAFKISGLIARMGDCAKSVAYRSIEAGDCRGVDLAGLAAMERAVSAMIKAALDAFTARDAVGAARVAAMDPAVDTYYASIFRGLIDCMTADNRTIVPATHLAVVAQKLERAGDHAVAVAETVRFAAGAGA
jgi:phosphate transport system protein